MRYRGYLLAVLVLVLAFNQVDRLALGLVLQDIKREFGSSDTQLGLLSGIAFALFYSVMGIPIARWADRGNRVLIISGATCLWSAAVVVCGAAGNFLQLLLVRIGVAVGEAGFKPAAHSLLADYFPRAERPRAAARFMLGIPLSVVIGYFFAGWLNQLYGWRATFMLLGLPGTVLGVVAWFTLREPRREKDVSNAAPDAPQPGFKEVFRTLWSNRTFRHLLFFYSILLFFNYGIAKWQPAFFMRSHGLQTGELGAWLAVIYGVGGFLGTYWGGEWAARRAAHDERLQLRLMALVACGLSVVDALIYLSASRYAAFALMGVAAVGGGLMLGPLLGMIQTLMPERMRATAISILYLFANLIGMGLGPLAAGMLSDALRPWAGEDSLRYSLLALCPGFVWGGWHAWRASQFVSGDLTGH